jgi:hypothetical protein
MLHALRIGKTEDTTTLAINIAARGGLPKRVVVDNIVGLRGCRNSQQTEKKELIPVSSM